MSRFVVTIKEVTTETKIRGKDWEQGAGKITADNPEGYGYSPQIEKEVGVTHEIFSQNTDDLDLVAVIKAVNGI